VEVRVFVAVGDGVSDGSGVDEALEVGDVAAVAVRRFAANWVAVRSMGATTGLPAVCGDAVAIATGETDSTEAGGDARGLAGSSGEAAGTTDASDTGDATGDAAGLATEGEPVGSTEATGDDGIGVPVAGGATMRGVSAGAGLASATGDPSSGSTSGDAGGMGLACSVASRSAAS
jgi:hypothetical protein